jgi:hypothetical protein
MFLRFQAVHCKVGIMRVAVAEDVGLSIEPQTIALFQQLALSGLFQGVNRVIELGEQAPVGVCDSAQLESLHLALGRELPDGSQAIAATNSRELFQSLGISWATIESEASSEHEASDQTIRLDLNRDAVPATQRQHYDLVLNFGRTAQVLNQLNAFQMIHDLTRVGGLMLHVLSFRGAYYPGFFNIQPEMLRALARSNGYEIAGWWLLSRSAPTTVLPWVDDTINYLKLSDPNPWAFAVVFRRVYAQEFFVPYQFMYEEHRSDVNAVRYNYMVDGKVLSGIILKSIKLAGSIPPGTKLSEVPFRNLVREGKRRVIGGVRRRSRTLADRARVRTTRVIVGLPTWLYWKPMNSLVGEQRAREFYFSARRAIGLPSASDPEAKRRSEPK